MFFDYYFIFHSCQVFGKKILITKNKLWRSPTHLFIYISGTSIIFSSLRHKMRYWAGCSSCTLTYNKSWWWFILPSLKKDKKQHKISPRQTPNTPQTERKIIWNNDKCFSQPSCICRKHVNVYLIQVWTTLGLIYTKNNNYTEVHTNWKIALTKSVMFCVWQVMLSAA